MGPMNYVEASMNVADNNTTATQEFRGKRAYWSSDTIEEGLAPMRKCPANARAVPALRIKDLYVDRSFEWRGNKDFDDIWEVLMRLFCWWSWHDTIFDGRIRDHKLALVKTR